MISELQQEHAALYALELLDADEASAFEQQIAKDAELRELVRELREAAALLVLSSHRDEDQAPPALRAKVLAAVASGGIAVAPRGDNGGTVRQRVPALPWAIAALLMGCLVTVTWRDSQQRETLASLRAARQTERQTLTNAVEEARRAADATLAHVSFCALDPTPDFATAQPRAAVLWDEVHHQGKLRINRLAPPGAGKDYQLWTVEAGRKDAVSAGVVHVDAEGKADLPFQPTEVDGKPVVAVAISLERAGGSPTNQGPILLLGKL